MTTHSQDLRERVIACYNEGKNSIRAVATRFMVNKDTVHQWLKQYREQGHLNPKKPGSKKPSQLQAYQEQVRQMVFDHPDYTLREYCEDCERLTGVRVSESVMCRFLQKQHLSRKKKSFKASQGGTEKNQQARLDYWEQIRDVAAQNLIFLDEMGVLLGIMREYGRSPQGERIYAQKPFYRGARVTVIGAITQEKVLAWDIIGKSMTGEDFKQFLQEHLVPLLTKESVLVMDRLKCHQVAGVKEMIESTGARIVYLSGYSPDFNPIEHLWWELKAFLRYFVPKSSQVVADLLRLAIQYLVSSEHLRNYFTHCCYCTA